MPEAIYTLSLRDQVTAGLHNIDGAANKLEHTMGSLRTKITNVAEAFGISFALYSGMQAMHQGIEAFEQLHKAEAQLENTMQNMGTYTKESFEKMTASAGDFAKGVQFNQAEIIELQSQLGLVGNIGEDVMKRMVTVSADMATKFKMGLSESGELIGKAINNPEIARRLAMRLKIDPGIIKHIQDLAKHGHEAQAQMELLAVAESKVSGAARAAFDADPLAQYNKLVYNIQMAVGEWGTKVLRTLTPALEGLVGTVRDSVHWLKDHKDLLIKLALIAAPLATLYLVQELRIIAIKAATTAWTAAQWALNLVMEANPLVIVGELVAGLIVYFYRVHHSTESWGQSLKTLWDITKNVTYLIADGFKSAFETIIYTAEHMWLKMRELWDRGNHWLLVSTTDNYVSPLTKQLKDLEDHHKSVQEAYTKTMEAYRLNIKEDWGAHSLQTAAAGTTSPGDISKKKQHFAGEDEHMAKETKGAKGNKAVTINIKIDSLVKDFKVSTVNMKESAGKVQEIITQVLMGAVNNSQIIAEH